MQIFNTHYVYVAIWSSFETSKAKVELSALPLTLIGYIGLLVIYQVVDH